MDNLLADSVTCVDTVLNSLVDCTADECIAEAASRLAPCVENAQVDFGICLADERESCAAYVACAGTVPAGDSVAERCNEAFTACAPSYFGAQKLACIAELQPAFSHIRGEDDVAALAREYAACVR
ncbi:MAG: hypothetical protein M5R36_26060 [Deltaproteobacteria bacterium]|nr:hypothetical protein [Deltaproteobacteria bacterium]